MFKGHRGEKKSSTEGRGGVMGEKEEGREGGGRGILVPSQMVHPR